MKWNLVRIIVGITCICLGALLFSFALYYQQKIHEYDRLLAQVEGHPFLGYEYVVEFQAEMRAAIPQLINEGAILCAVGLLAFLLPKIKKGGEK